MSRKTINTIAIIIIWVAITPFYVTGMCLYWASKIITALAHFCLFNFSTAKEAITENWLRPLVNLRDAL